MDISDLSKEEREKTEKAAMYFRSAFKGLGTDEESVIAELTKLNNSQRQIVKKTYLALYGKVNFKNLELLQKFF